MRGNARVGWALAALAALGGWWIARCADLDVRDITPEKVRTFVLSFGVWAPLSYLLIYGQPIVPLPATLMISLAGAAFGKEWGLLAALAGSTLRACLAFLVARRLGRATVAKFLKGRIAMFDQQLGRNSFKAVLLIRLIPNVPFDVQNYALGFSQVRFGPYALASLLGIAPYCVAFAYLGESITSPRQLWKLGVAVLLLIGVMAVQRTWRVRRLQNTPDRREQV